MTQAARVRARGRDTGRARGEGHADRHVLVPRTRRCNRVARARGALCRAGERMIARAARRRPRVAMAQAFAHTPTRASGVDFTAKETEGGEKRGCTARAASRYVTVPALQSRWRARVDRTRTRRLTALRELRGAFSARSGPPQQNGGDAAVGGRAAGELAGAPGEIAIRRGARIAAQLAARLSRPSRRSRHRQARGGGVAWQGHHPARRLLSPRNLTIL